LNAHIPFAVTVGLGNFLIDSGKSQTVIVQFAPTDTGTYRDSVIVSSNTDNSTKRIVVYLRAVVKSSDLIKPQISIRSFTLDFGQMQVNSGADQQLSFSIKNVSDSTRTLNVVLLFPHDPFTLSGTPDHFQLAQNESQYLTVHFTPNTVGKYFDSIIVVSDAPQSRIPVYIKAEVLGPNAVRTPSTNAQTAIVFPNPAIKRVNINLYSSRVGDVSCSLFDLNGRSVLTHRASLVEGDNIIDLDLSSIATGRYICRVDGLGEPITLPVIVE
jgi:hypothetical protein